MSDQNSNKKMDESDFQKVIAKNRSQNNANDQRVSLKEKSTPVANKSANEDKTKSKKPSGNLPPVVDVASKKSKMLNPPSSKLKLTHSNEKLKSSTKTLAEMRLAQKNRKERLHPLEQILGKTAVRYGGGAVDLRDVAQNFEDGVIGLYFSAHWCPPCRLFTPMLMFSYDELKKSQKKLEIVFISCDVNIHSFNEYFKLMPWLAVPFEERKKRDDIKTAFSINNIPTLLLLNPRTGTVFEKNGVRLIKSDPLGTLYPWIILPKDKLKATFNRVRDMSRFARKFSELNTQKKIEEAEELEGQAIHETTKECSVKSEHDSQRNATDKDPKRFSKVPSTRSSGVGRRDTFKSSSIGNTMHKSPIDEESTEKNSDEH